MFRTPENKIPWFGLLQTLALLGISVDVFSSLLDVSVQAFSYAYFVQNCNCYPSIRCSTIKIKIFLFSPPRTKDVFVVAFPLRLSLDFGYIVQFKFRLCRQFNRFSKKLLPIYPHVPDLKQLLSVLLNQTSGSYALKDLSVALLIIFLLHCSVFKVQAPVDLTRSAIPRRTGLTSRRSNHRPAKAYALAS